MPLFAPIGVQLGLPPEVLIMVIGIGASCAFMMPVATPPNAIIMGSGHVKQKRYDESWLLAKLSCHRDCNRMGVSILGLM